MSQPAQGVFSADALWGRYRNNLPRHCIGVSRYLQARLMHRLTEELGHNQLRLNYEPFITLVGAKGARLTELADWLAISKQACNQTVNQMESLGYLARIPDPADGRAKLVVLTERGRQLVADGARLIGEVEAEFVELIGASQHRQLVHVFSALYRELDLPAQQTQGLVGAQDAAIGGVLPRISDYMMQSLMELTRTRGHPALKMSYGQVLGLIGPDGGRIQHMARVQEVSKQAISAVANELEGLGYIHRESDPRDNRQILLKLTAKGEQLLLDSVDSVDSLMLQWQQLLGKAALGQLSNSMQHLYESLHLEAEVFAEVSSETNVDLQLLALRLKKQLGSEGSAELARLLMEM